MQLKYIFFALTLVSCVAASSRAQRPSSASPLSTGYLYNFESDIDDGGNVSSQFFYARAGVPLYRAEGRVIALSAGYSLNSYDFSGGATPFSFGSLSPWDDIHTVRLGLPIRWKFGERWDFFAASSIGFVGESGADFGDSLQGGGIAAFSYKFSDRLSLGPGIGYMTQIEDDASIFPVIAVNWKLTEALSLTTGPSVGATLGPGLALNWDISDKTRFSLGARYEKLRFRLDKNNSASPGGVGEDRGIPVFVGLSFQAAKHLRLSFVGGVDFGNELQLEDVGGNEILESDYDPSPFVGVNASLTF